MDHVSRHFVLVEERDAACAQIRAECTTQLERERQQFKEANSQAADLIKQQAEKLGEMTARIARRSTDSRQLKYMVRGSQDPARSGSVPLAIFEAEPDSVLNRTYNGEWEYAQDAEGRANVNSNPAHWPLILDWLSFGAVPRHPTPAFVAECKYWQLNRLLAKLKAADRQQMVASADRQQSIASAEKQQSIAIQERGRHNLTLSHVIKNDRAGFNLCGTIEHFRSRFLKETDVRISFEAFDQKWELVIDPYGTTVVPYTGDDHYGVDLEISFGRDPFKYLAAKECVDLQTDTEWEERGWLPPPQGHLPWVGPADAFDALQSEPFLDLHGSIQVSVDVLFASRAGSSS